jgi:hypothetical protein
MATGALFDTAITEFFIQPMQLQILVAGYNALHKIG